MSVGILFFSQKVSAQTDYEKIITNVNAEIKKGFSTSTAAINAGTATFMSNMNADGSFNDIPYAAGVAGDVPFNNHLTRLRTMAIAYTFTGATYYSDVNLYNKIVLGLKYWNGNIHDAYNWYNDQISYPQLLGEMLVIMRSGSTQLPAADLSAAINYLSSRDNPSTKTGANRVDEAVHWVYKAALTNDAAALNIAVDQAQSTLAIVNSGVEGINADYAFLQHNSQLMMQGYGRDFMDGIYNVAVYLVGTSFNFAPANLEIAYKFLHNSYVGTARGAYKDFNLDGRGISRINSNKGITANIVANAIKVHPAYATILQADYDRITQAQPASYSIPQPYHVHYWTGDYTTHNRPAYAFGVRAVSTRTVRTETLNGENKLGTWLTDGATSIRVDGGEYYNIFPAWDWNKVPGTTMRQFATPQTNNNNVNTYGNTSFTGGVSDSTYGASTYKQNNGGVTATKSWFFFDNEIVCLGAGVSSTQSEMVATTVNQALLSGSVSRKAAGATTTIAAGTQEDFSGNLNWVLHNKVGYFFPAGGNVSVSNQTQSGDWSAIGTASGAVSTGVFKLWMNHGATPANATYAYVVAPGLTTAAQMDAYNSSDIQILSNTPALQAVKHVGLNMVQVIFSTAGTLNLTGTAVTSITVDKPCAVLIKNINTTNPVISIADPSQQSAAINLTLTYQTEPQETIFAVMPTGNFKGSSKALTANSSAALFTPGVLAVLRIGGINGSNGTTGTTTPGTAGAPVHIDKYSVTAPGTFTYLSSIDLPVASTDNIFASSSTNEGYIIRSANKQWLSVMGYATKAVSGTIYSTTANPNIARTLGLIKYDGTVDLSTALSNFPVSGTAATAESAITTDGTVLWSSTNQGVSPMGILYTTPGSKDAASGNSAIVTASTGVIASVRTLSIFGGDLYYTGGAGNRIGTVAATGGLPVTAGSAVMTGLPVAAGSPAFATYTASQMVMFDMDSSVLGYDVMYFTNANLGAGLAGIYKYCKNADGQWAAFGSFGTTATEGIYFGLTGELVDGLPVLYATRGISATQNLATNQLLQLMESSGYNANMSATVAATTDATVSGKAGTIRGVAFYPTASYYYKGTGNLNELTSWGENVDGSGNAPINFSNDAQIFHIYNGTAATLSANLVVSGVNSKIVLGDGTNAASLSIPATFSISGDMDVYNNAVLNIQNTVAPHLVFVAKNSTVNFSAATAQTIRPMAFGNFTNSNNSSATLNGTVTVAGNLVQNGLFNGNATVIAPNGFTNTGTLAPGNSPGLFSITGDFTNAATGTLAIELGDIGTPGVEYDLLAVSGNATMGGTLNIAAVNGLVLQAGQTFIIVTAGAVSGTFATVNWPAGVTGNVVYTATTVELNVISGTLPLNLISFSGSVLQSGKNQLQWKTANEDNVAYFAIERSDNGTQFTFLAKKAAAGTGNNSYEQLDANPFAGNNYYRLKIVDNDGKFVYSNIIKLKNNASTNFSIFPNPAKNNLIVTHAAGSERSFISLLQADGKLLLKQKITTGALQSSLDISRLIPGVYIITVGVGKNSSSYKLIKE